MNDVGNLEKKYKQAIAKQELLEKLFMTTDIASIMEAILKTLKDLIPFHTISYLIAKSEGQKFSNLLYILTTRNLQKGFTTIVQKSMFEFIKSLADDIEGKVELLEQLERENHCDFIEGEMAQNGAVKPSDFFLIPFQIPHSKKIGGLFHVALTEDQQTFSEEDKKFAIDIINTAATNFEKIRSLINFDKVKIIDLVNSMEEAVVLFDIKKTIVVSNPAMQKITKFDNLSNIIAFLEKADELSVIENRPKISKAIEQLLKGSKRYHAPKIKIKGKYFELYIVPVHGGENNISGGAMILHDITQMTEVDQMKTRFVSLASHQLRTPLTAIKLFIEMLGSKSIGSLNETQSEYLNNVKISTERMVKLVNNLLSISRLEAGRLKINPQLIDIQKLIEESINSCQNLAENSNCKISFKKPKTELHKLLVDPLIMTEIIQNIIGNALRYTTTDSGEVAVELKEENSQYIIIVKDNGIGIPKEIQSKIFEKFFRAEEAIRIQTEGTGLGLYIAKMLLEASGGDMKFKSKGKGKGATFFISIPAEVEVKK